MLDKAASYINVEEAQAARRKADKPPLVAYRPERRAPQTPDQPLPRARDARPTFQPRQDARPMPRVAAVQVPRPGPWGPRYCTYHRSHTHATNDCFQFAHDSRRAAELGLPLPELAPQVQRMMEEQRNAAGQASRPRAEQEGPSMQPQGHTGEPGEAREAENRGNADIRDIGMISGGPTDGDSGRARKSHEGRLEIHAIGCSQEQAAGLVISFRPSVFEEMQIDASELQPVATSLYGFTDELANKAAEIRKRFDEITKEWKLLKLPKKAGKRKRSPMLSDMNRETGSLVVESDVLGREEEKDVLVKWLLSEDDTTGNGVSVIAVIGMGGLGKTTLAQLVYNDQRVKSYFDLTGWVCVSENFHVVSLTEKILQSFTKVKVHEELDELQRALQENLQGKRFLLVLDDVWNDNFCLWEQLKKPLLSAIAGKVIVTTRNHSVARIMQTTRDSLKLNVLPFDVCWSLFKKVTLGGADRSLRPDLEDIGRRIVEKCKGLPLAAKLIGGALRNEEDKESWTDIIESEIWKLDDRNIEVSPALQISYDCMLIQLKRCFQYLSLFPKDTSLSSKRIVQLWMPQGIFPLDGDKRAEDIGSDYIKRLVERSMLNPEEGSYFSMHDLVHDLAQYVAQDECLCVIDNNFDRKKLQEIRHLSVNGENIKLCQDKTNFLESDNLFQKLKYIRALDLNYMNITKLPDSLGNLKLLRYLSIEYTNVRSLPESICNLYNLQILHAESVYTLPRHIGNLINLRHLWFSHQVVFLPSGIGNLTNLQTLNHFSVSREEEHCNIGELNSLMKLGGSISIDNIGEVNNFSNSKFPLKTKKYLDSLELYWYDWFDYADEKKAEWQLEYLEPHVNLKTLEITKYPGIKFVGWVGASSFTKLIKLILRNCKNCSKLPPLGQLPSLEELEIIGMDGVQHVGREFCSMLIPSPSSQGELNIWKMDDVQHVGSGISSTLEPFSSSYKIAFPSLKLLLFSSMKNWKAWDGIQSGDFPNLHFIEIYECSKLINFPKWPLLPSSGT
ncbi:putative disease resistance protein RGA4 [Zingiber officinale]|uniref:putative disease resistance protein RGA4 n=1 Tax=Zingiber officinale TaxID=94328 RepID=UPI001C4B5831|nr:putative disease resistance protein RGA4 [Zingiber officinale]